MNSKLKKNLSILFILFTSLFTQVLSIHAEKSILKYLHESSAVNAIIKSYSGFVGIGLAIFILFLSRKHSVQNVIKIMHGFSLVAALTFFFVVTPFNVELALPSSLLEFRNFFLPTEHKEIILKHWHMIIFYGLVVHWSSAMLVLFYGYTNELFSFKTASKYYPLFGVFSLILNVFLNPIIIKSIQQMIPLLTTFSQYWYYIQGCVIIFFIVSSYLAYSYLFNMPGQKKDETESKMGWRYASAIGILAGFSGLIILISKTVWKYNNGLEFPSPSQYTHHLSSIGAFSSIATLMSLGVLIFMSFCLEEKLGRAWKNFYYAISLVTVILGLTFFCFTLFDNIISEYISPKNSQASLHTITVVSAAYQILITSIAYPVILSLKEVAIIAIEKKYRFTAKLIIDLFFVKGFIFFGHLILWALVQFRGSITLAFPYLAVVFFVCSFSRFIFIYYIGSNLPQISNPTNPSRQVIS